MITFLLTRANGETEQYSIPDYFPINVLPYDTVGDGKEVISAEILSYAP